MAEHDPQAFEHLFEAEPAQPDRRDVAEWTTLYTRLVDMLEQQLSQTQRFVEESPEALRTYLSRENTKILAEELDVFRRRLEHWRGLESGPAGERPA